MNRNATTRHIKAKVPLLFQVSLQLSSIRYKLPKSTPIYFEFVNNKTITASENFHKLEANGAESSIRETIELPVLIHYESKKGYFVPNIVQVNVFTSGSFGKKLATGSIDVTKPLNNKLTSSRETIKFEKGSDKNACLAFKLSLDFKKIYLMSEASSFEVSRFSISSIRLFNKPCRAKSDH